MGTVDTRRGGNGGKKWSGIGGYSRNFDESEFSRFHCNFLATAARENRIKRARGGRRIASLSAIPRIRTNIFPKQLDCIESEKDRQIERIRVREDGKAGERSEARRGRIVPRAMVPSGAGTAKGWRVPTTPLPAPLRLVLFVSASRIRTTHPPALKGERERERDSGSDSLWKFISKVMRFGRQITRTATCDFVFSSFESKYVLGVK